MQPQTRGLEVLDDPERAARRESLLQGFVVRGLPIIRPTLETPRIEPANERAYAISVGLTQFLLARGDMARFLDFVAAGPRVGWDRSLNLPYQIRDVDELQSLWQAAQEKRGDEHAGAYSQSALAVLCKNWKLCCSFPAVMLP